MKNKVDYEKEYRFLCDLIDNYVEEDVEIAKSDFLNCGIDYCRNGDSHNFRTTIARFKVILSLSGNTLYILFEGNDEVKESYEVFMDGYGETCEYHNYTDLFDSYVIEIDNKSIEHSEMQEWVLSRINKLIMELNEHLLSISKKNNNTKKLKK